MASHTIILTVTEDNKVTANLNPLSVQPGDTVTFQPEVQNPAGRQITLDFQLVHRAANLIGPFVSLSPALVGKVGAGQRFFYKVFANGTELNWTNPVPGGNFGGIDVPQPPP